MATTDVTMSFVCENCSTTGASTFTLTGAVTGFETFLTAYGANAKVFYFARSSSGTKWEEGWGIVSGATLTRNVFRSSAGTGTAEDFTGATPFRVYSAQANALLNSMVRWNFGTTRPSWLPANAVWQDDEGSNIIGFDYFDGTDDILLPFAVNTSSNESYPRQGGVRQPQTIVTTTAGAASIVSNGWPTWANMVDVHFDLIPATDAVSLTAVLQTGAGTDYTTGDQKTNLTFGAGSTVTAAGSTTATSIGLGGNIDNNAAYGGASGVLRFYNIQDTRSRRVVGHHTYFDSSNQLILMVGATVPTTAATTGVKFAFSSGNVASGSRLTTTYYP